MSRIATRFGRKVSSENTFPPNLALVARTARLDVDPADVDLVAFAGPDGVLWEHDGISLAGGGVAARVPVDRVDEVLAVTAIEQDDVDGPGTGAIAVGALPFSLEAGASLVVPERVLGRAADGTVWSTSIGARGAPPPAADRAVEHSGGRSPSDFRLTAVPGHEQWHAAVTEAVACIGTGAVEKIVLARAVDVEADGPLIVTDILRRLRVLFPSCMVFSVDGFVGASPELLVGRLGPDVCSQPLAGTVARSGDPATDERLARSLLASTKDRHEHALVVDAVASALRPVCEQLDIPAAPAIVPLRNVAHLGTTLWGRLRPTAPSALALARLLHPTPAVAGTPTPAAMALLARLEGRSRGRYAGPVGWVDARGNGEWAVGIRSAEIDGNRARLMSGVGIVAGSDPDDELAETQLKLQALLAAIVRP
jgi:menaquinone-specific isochorismate synthase